MSKKVTSVNLDEEIADHFANDQSKNLSGTVNMLLEQYLAGNGGELAMLELRQQQLESEVDELSGRLETKRKELEQVNEQIGEIKHARQSKQEEDLERYAQHVQFTELSSGLSVDSPDHELEELASKAGVDVDELVETARRMYDNA